MSIWEEQKKILAKNLQHTRAKPRHLLNKYVVLALDLLDKKESKFYEYCIMTIEIAHKTKVIKADCRKASKEEIKTFKKQKKCSHTEYKSGDKLLIYNTKNWLYDERFCGVCNTFLGLI